LRTSCAGPASRRLLRRGLAFVAGAQPAIEDGELLAQRLVLGAQPAVVGQQRLVALAQGLFAGALGVRHRRGWSGWRPGA
jgi:hypothetical protein